jgi:DUF2075 family protein/predicted GIY-YIG superfamily endonuclease
MTDFRIERLPFDQGALQVWADADIRHKNWPVVYTLHGDTDIYVGETTNAAGRVIQHLSTEDKKALRRVQIIFNDMFNKSACLDLESHLIRYFSADAKYRVLNKNAGLTDADYFDRDSYRRSFGELFEELRKEGIFTRSIPDIENSDLFKFSPFKALNRDQAVAVDGILDVLLRHIEDYQTGTIVVQGDPGTGKTIVAVYVVKLLMDIAASRPGEELDEDTLFSEFFRGNARDLLTDVRIGLVIPQQSLRKTLQRVFKQTPSLSPSMVLGPFDVGKSGEPYDLLIIDEAHRLGQRSNQPSASLNKSFTEINEKLFGRDDNGHTQLDWMKAQSTHQILLIDQAQSVKPADLPKKRLDEELAHSRAYGTFFHLQSQMRVSGGSDYIDFVRRLLNGEATEIPDFGDYDFRIFTDFREMRNEILKRDEEVGLSRLVAGYAWEWKSKADPHQHDIEIDGVKLWWNRTTTDWINSPTSLEEVGSIHTVQGYDLNYAGVIIGNDLVYDAHTKQFVFNRDSYFDKKGKENNPRLGIQYTDEDLLEYVKNIYRVLLTRGIRGTYVLWPNARQGFGQSISPRS